MLTFVHRPRASGRFYRSGALFDWISYYHHINERENEAIETDTDDPSAPEESNLLMGRELKEIMQLSDMKRMNEQLYRITGIIDFFHSEEEAEDFKAPNTEDNLQGDREFGDFQTPVHLTDQICRYLFNDYHLNPALVIEPTFGKGNFIRSAVQILPDVKAVYGIEIQRNYYWLTKKSMLRQALTSPAPKQPDIRLFHDDIFRHSFDQTVMNSGEEVLIIGNPPWVTNSEQGALKSANLPKKQNFKEHKGLDALTGKSNFDICEYIIMMMLEMFHCGKGTLAMLCKNSVAKKIVQELPKRKFNISDMKLLHIDAKKDFNAATDASLFVVRLGKRAERLECDTYRLDEPGSKISSFGWFDHKFVSDIQKYKSSCKIDDACQFIWRSGIKHDCSSVMELDSAQRVLKNKLKETVDIEDTFVFDLLKSSDLKSGVISQAPRKKVIVTQRSLGQDTAALQQDSPKLWEYLWSRKSLFDARKSSIYKGKPDFSIFGVGDYSFSPYKVAISGMYKNSRFTFVPPVNDKPVMLDDTCYFLSFDELRSALFTFALLNGALVQDFLQSVVFLDEKRPYTKEILMRIDLLKAAERTSYSEIKKVLDAYELEFMSEALTMEGYRDYIGFLKSQALRL